MRRTGIKAQRKFNGAIGIGKTRSHNHRLPPASSSRTIIPIVSPARAAANRLRATLQKCQQLPPNFWRSWLAFSGKPRIQSPHQLIRMTTRLHHQDCNSIWEPSKGALIQPELIGCPWRDRNRLIRASIEDNPVQTQSETIQTTQLFLHLYGGVLPQGVLSKWAF